MSTVDSNIPKNFLKNLANLPKNIPILPTCQKLFPPSQLSKKSNLPCKPSLSLKIFQKRNSHLPKEFPPGKSSLPLSEQRNHRLHVNLLVLSHHVQNLIVMIMMIAMNVIIISLHSCATRGSIFTQPNTTGVTKVVLNHSLAPNTPKFQCNATKTHIYSHNSEHTRVPRRPCNFIDIDMLL